MQELRVEGAHRDVSNGDTPAHEKQPQCETMCDDDDVEIPHRRSAGPQLLAIPEDGAAEASHPAVHI